MRTLPLMISAVLLLIGSADLSANDETQPPISDDLPSQNERWYSYWGFGVGAMSYDVSEAENKEDLPVLPSSNQFTFVAEVLGFYWPLENKKTILGFALHSSVDDFKTPKGSAKVTTALLGFNALHFFGQNVGHGFFLRGGVGYAWSTFGGDFEDEGRDIALARSGIGLILAAGYGFPISDGTRLLFTGGIRGTSADKFYSNLYFATIGLLL